MSLTYLLDIYGSLDLRHMFLDIALKGRYVYRLSYLASHDVPTDASIVEITS